MFHSGRVLFQSYGTEAVFQKVKKCLTLDCQSKISLVTKRWSAGGKSGSPICHSFFMNHPSHLVQRNSVIITIMLDVHEIYIQFRLRFELNITPLHLTKMSSRFLFTFIFKTISPSYPKFFKSHFDIMTRRFPFWHGPQRVDQSQCMH